MLIYILVVLVLQPESGDAATGIDPIDAEVVLISIEGKDIELLALKSEPRDVELLLAQLLLHDRHIAPIVHLVEPEGDLGVLLPCLGVLIGVDIGIVALAIHRHTDHLDGALVSLGIREVLAIRAPAQQAGQIELLLVDPVSHAIHHVIALPVGRHSDLRVVVKLLYVQVIVDHIGAHLTIGGEGGDPHLPLRLIEGRDHIAPYIVVVRRIGATAPVDRRRLPQNDHMEAIVADEIVVKGIEGALPRLGGIEEHRLLLPGRIRVAHHPLMVRTNHREGVAVATEGAEAAACAARVVDPAIDVR